MPSPVPNLPQSITAAINGINTTETVLESMFIGSVVEAGDSYMITGFGTCTTSGGNLSTFTIRVGTTGTVADLAVGTIACGAGISGTNVPFYFEILITFRTIGPTGTVLVNGLIETINQLGISVIPVVISTNSVATTVATNVNNYLSITYKTGGVTTTSSFQNISAHKVK